METTTKIHDGMTINEAIQVRPGTVAVFDALGLDACCGGSLTIRDAATRHGLDPAVVLRALDAAPEA